MFVSPRSRNDAPSSVFFLVPPFTSWWLFLVPPYLCCGPFCCLLLLSGCSPLNTKNFTSVSRVINKTTRRVIVVFTISFDASLINLDCRVKAAAHFFKCTL